MKKWKIMFGLKEFSFRRSPDVRGKCSVPFLHYFVLLWFMCSILNGRKNNLATITCNPVYHRSVVTLCHDIMSACPFQSSHPLQMGIWDFYDVIRCVLWFQNRVSCSVLNSAVYFGTPADTLTMFDCIKSPWGNAFAIFYYWWYLHC